MVLLKVDIKKVITKNNGTFVVITPTRRFFDIDEFDIVHLDEAYHLFKKDFDKSNINKSYNFLRYRKRPVNRTKIRSTNSKVTETTKMMELGNYDKNLECHTDNVKIRSPILRWPRLKKN